MSNRDAALRQGIIKRSKARHHGKMPSASAVDGTLRRDKGRHLALGHAKQVARPIGKRSPTPTFQPVSRPIGARPAAKPVTRPVGKRGPAVPSYGPVARPVGTRTPPAPTLPGARPAVVPGRALPGRTVPGARPATNPGRRLGLGKIPGANPGRHLGLGKAPGARPAAPPTKGTSSSFSKQARPASRPR